MHVYSVHTPLHTYTHRHKLNKTQNNNDFEICYSTHQHSNDTFTEIKNLDRVIKDSKYQTEEKSWKITLLDFKMKCKVTVIRRGLRILMGYESIKKKSVLI